MSARCTAQGWTAVTPSCSALRSPGQQLPWRSSRCSCLVPVLHCMLVSGLPLLLPVGELLLLLGMESRQFPLLPFYIPRSRFLFFSFFSFSPSSSLVFFDSFPIPGFFFSLAHLHSSLLFSFLVLSLLHHHHHGCVCSPQKPCQAALVLEQAREARGPRSSLPQWLLHRLVRFHGCRVSQVRHDDS